MTTTRAGRPPGVAVTRPTPPPVQPLVVAVLKATPPRGEWVSYADAARIAAVVLRWAADHAINPDQPDDPWWTAGNLRALAAELVPDDPPPPDATADLDPDELEAGHG